MSIRRTSRGRAGFTVIELMAVIALTVIVGAIGCSAWRTHKVRAQVTEGMEAARPIQEAIVREFRRSNDAPASIFDTGIGPGAASQSSRFVTSMAVENGRVDLVYGGQADSKIAGRRLSLTPYETATLQIAWLCGNDIPQPGLSPLGFASGGRQAVQIPTTIEWRYLPAACR
jgi:type II secretory pathway pseudopilin PulG